MSKIKISGNASGTGVVTLTAPNTNTDRTITLPDDTQTLIGTNASGNVGIGTTTLEDKLNLEQPYVASGEMAISFNQSNYANRASKIIHKMDGTGNGGSIIIAPNSNGGDAIEAVRVTPNGLTFNGDTAAANALDDYEEGTWDVHIADATSGGNKVIVTDGGAYRKIGNVVHWSATFEIDKTGLTATNGFYLQNLPFLSAGFPLFNEATVRVTGGFNITTNGYGILPTVRASSTSVTFYEAIDNASTPNLPVSSVLGGDMRINGTYFV